MANTKHYIITSITLGVIATVSALVIGGINLLTRNKIEQNEKNKVKEGIAFIFGDDSKIASEADNKDFGLSGEYKYVNYIYTVSDNSDKNLGFGFKVTGSNMYGKISLIAGFEEKSHSFIGMYVITNEQTYASTLEDNYIVPVNAGERNVDDVSCGATYGAKLIKSMIDEATLASDEIWKD